MSLEPIEGARATYEAHFTTVIKLLRASRTPGDASWRSASRHLSFPEIKWICLGYGAQSVSMRQSFRGSRADRGAPR